MNYPTFLKQVDRYTENCSKEGLAGFVHEVARTLPAESRVLFLDTLYSYMDSGRAVSERQVRRDDSQNTVRDQITKIEKSLDEIDNGDLCLESEYNEEWDDWNDGTAEEFRFEDPQGVLDIINAAVELLHTCVDRELYEDGAELADELASVSIAVTGDYDDSMHLSDLATYDLLDSEYEAVVKDALYLAYLGSPLETRASVMLRIFKNLRPYSFTLESLLLYGSEEISDLQDFLPSWIGALASDDSQSTAGLLTEAFSLLDSPEAMLSTARRYAQTQPVLYLNLLEKLRKENNDHDLLRIGEEALNAISGNPSVRRDIALLTAGSADRLGKEDLGNQYRLEAFRSSPDVTGYLRVIAENGPVNTACLHDIINGILPADSQRTTLLFFDQQFDQVISTGMNVKSGVGWSSTFMKKGIALFLLLLNQSEVTKPGLHSMLIGAADGCGFLSKNYLYGTDQSPNQDSYLLFNRLFEIWKSSIMLSEAQVSDWLSKLDSWIAMRVAGIMGGNHRNYYAECAAYVAALGEVLEARGERNAKARLMEQYRSEYSRRSAFHRELRAYGMK